MKKNRILSIAIILILMYLSSCGGYLSETDSYSKDNALLLSFLDIVVISLAMMFVPFVFKKILKNGFDYSRGKKICKWNSIMFLIISVIMNGIYIANYESGGKTVGFVGGLGAIAYYFINKWIFVERSGNKLPKKVCANCKSEIEACEDVCPKCKLFVTEKMNVFKKIRCVNCGSVVDSDDNFCEKCHSIFSIDKNINRSVSTTNKKEAVIEEKKEKEIDKSNDVSVDQKFSDLTKLKELLDKDILTKEEFDKEKKKILK